MITRRELLRLAAGTVAAAALPGSAIAKNGLDAFPSAPAGPGPELWTGELVDISLYGYAPPVTEASFNEFYPSTLRDQVLRGEIVMRLDADYQTVTPLMHSLFGGRQFQIRCGYEHVYAYFNAKLIADIAPKRPEMWGLCAGDPGLPSSVLLGFEIVPLNDSLPLAHIIRLRYTADRVLDAFLPLFC